MTVHHLNTAASAARCQACNIADIAARILPAGLMLAALFILLGAGIFAVTRTTQFLSEHIKIIVR